MTPFDLIDAERHRLSPFSVPCPHCGHVTAYRPELTKLYPSHASQVAVDHGGADHDAVEGTLFGRCQCTNRDCQEFTHFVGPFVTEVDEEEEPRITHRFKLKWFFPAIPLIRVPLAAPNEVQALLRRAYAPAFSDQSASGHLVRSAIEALLTRLRVPRFVITKGRKRRLSLHERIQQIPARFDKQRNKLLAVKWIGNVASHADLTRGGLQSAFKIVENVLEELYGTEKRELLRSVRRINRRRKP